MRMKKSVKAKFQLAIALGAELAGSPAAYDAWAQQEQARVLIEYAQKQQHARPEMFASAQSA